MPKTRVDFWREKFETNIDRDGRNIAALRELGWQVLVVWECETKQIEELTLRLAAALGRREHADGES
ncbi:T/G mismatch-specific endonuclease [Sphingomonas sp. NFR15]|nr:T/G mismatch-specific endonuclease [Sphingomonas sp. NFR15]